jgi:hypothetical protein
MGALPHLAGSCFVANVGVLLGCRAIYAHVASPGLVSLYVLNFVVVALLSLCP